MKKYKGDYAYDEKSNMFVGVCPEFFGCSFYCQTLKDLKRCAINVLRVYASDQSITGKNVEFKELELQQEITLGL